MPARLTESVRERVSHVIAEAISEFAWKDPQKESVEPSAELGLQPRPLSHFLPLASATSVTSRSVSAAATLRPIEVIR